MIAFKFHSHQFNKLAAHNIFNKIDGIHIGVLHLSEDEHLPKGGVRKIEKYVAMQRYEFTIWDIS